MRQPDVPDVPPAPDTTPPHDPADAARQYCGAPGGIGLCQVGVHLTDASRPGQALVGRARHLGRDWAADSERRALTAVPDELASGQAPAGRRDAGTLHRRAVLVPLPLHRPGRPRRGGLHEAADRTGHPRREVPDRTGHGQVTCRTSWMRWSLISLTAAAVLAAALARTRSARSPPAAGLIPLTRPGLPALLRAAVLRAATCHRRWNEITAAAAI
jgi:hypothetical protein